MSASALEWCACNERLPPSKDSFLACNMNQGGVKFVAWWSNPANGYLATGGDLVGTVAWQNFTHWMPIPKDPKWPQP